MSDKLPPRVLVVEHDEVLNANLCNMIERYWFDVTRVRSCEEALRVATIYPPHVAIISSRIKDRSAAEMSVQIKKIQGLSELPIIFLTDESEPANNYNHVRDNYVEILQRPFTPHELLTAVRALIRKSNPVLQDKILKYKDISMDLSTFRVRRADREVHLGPTEFKILQLLVQNPGNIYSRRQIIDYVWGTNKEIAHRTIDVHINRIRTIMKTGDDDKSLIKTIRSAGYRLS